MRIASSKDLQTFEEPLILDTPQDFEEGMKFFAEAVGRIAQGENPKRIVVGLPGTLTEDRHGLFSAANLRGWEKQDIKKRLEELLHSTVYLQNDAALVGLGEAHNGAGCGFPIIAYVTVSTGVGGARIVDGKIDESKYGLEPGHRIVSMEDGETRDLESFISGTAVEKKFGVKPYEITDETVWDELAKILAGSLYNLILNWSPDVVVLGGSMFKEVGIKVPAVSKYLNELNKTYPTMPILKKAELGDLGGLYGGMAFLRSL